MKQVKTDKAPEAIGPYSQGMISYSLVFTSGQIPIEPSTGQIPEGIEAQARQSCLNVKAVLEEAGSKMDNVIKTTCFLADMKDFPKFNEVYGEFFFTCPARSCIGAKELPKGVLCEIEAIAEK